MHFEQGKIQKQSISHCTVMHQVPNNARKRLQVTKRVKCSCLYCDLVFRFITNAYRAGYKSYKVTAFLDTYRTKKLKTPPVATQHIVGSFTGFSVVTPLYRRRFSPPLRRKFYFQLAPRHREADHLKDVHIYLLSSHPSVP